MLRVSHITRTSPVVLADTDRTSRPRMVFVLLAVLAAGLIVRECAYRATGPIRFELNQRNAFYWGDRIVRGARAPDQVGAVSLPALWRSYVALYEDAEWNPAPRINTLDYPPLRLLMAAGWVDYLNWRHGAATEWRPEFARSFASFSMLMELAGAAAMFMLVSVWLGRAGSTGSEQEAAWHSAFRARHLPCVAATLMWLNPASIIDSHVWPHGQTWILPFYLLAVLAMIQRRFMAAGVCLGIGAMFKGQILLVAPALILWPLFQRRYLGSARVLAGMVVGAVVVVWPWLARGSMAWARASFMSQGIYSDVLRKGISLNLPALLGKTCDMTLHQCLVDQIWFGWHVTLEVGSALMALYLSLLACCAWGMASHDSAGSRRLLAAIAAPWAVMFFVLGQMDERYLVWAACFSAGTIALRWRVVVGHTFLTWAGFATMLEFLLIHRPDAAPGLLRVLVGLNYPTWILTAVGVAALLQVTLSGTRSSCRRSGQFPKAAATV